MDKRTWREHCSAGASCLRKGMSDSGNILSFLIKIDTASDALTDTGLLISRRRPFVKLVFTDYCCDGAVQLRCYIFCIRAIEVAVFLDYESSEL